MSAAFESPHSEGLLCIVLSVTGLQNVAIASRSSTLPLQHFWKILDL